MKTKSDMYQISVLPYDADKESYPVVYIVGLPEGKAGVQEHFKDEFINAKEREQFTRELGEMIIEHSPILTEYFSERA